MTLGAVISQLPGMRVLMTGGATRGCIFEGGHIFMTICALNGQVFSNQREDCLCVIEVNIFPLRGFMT